MLNNSIILVYFRNCGWSSKGDFCRKQLLGPHAWGNFIFHGETKGRKCATNIISSRSRVDTIIALQDPSAFKGFGPFMPGFDTVPYDDLEALQVSS
jgi:hypothetical protein